MRLSLSEYKKIIEENKEMSKGLTARDWERFNEWCEFDNIRPKMTSREWRLMKNGLLKQWHDPCFDINNLIKNK